MDQLLTHDVIGVILTYLSKTESFNFLNISKFMEPLRKILYGKYLFLNDKINNNDIKQYIHHLEYRKHEDYTIYCSLKTFYCHGSNLQSFKYLPTTLEVLRITSALFNQSMNKLPPKLKSLEILSVFFDKPLDNLPKTLESLNITSYSKDYSDQIFPNTIKTIIINNKVIKI